jgi:hypothetical protein
VNYKFAQVFQNEEFNPLSPLTYIYTVPDLKGKIPPSPFLVDVFLTVEVVKTLPICVMLDNKSRVGVVVIITTR